MPRVYVERAMDGRYLARISLRCMDCQQWFEFLGVPSGMDPNGARVSCDRHEIRLAIGTPDTLAEYYARAMAAIPDRKVLPPAPVKVKVTQVEPTLKVYKAA